MIPKHLITGMWHDRHRVRVSDLLVESAEGDVTDVCRCLDTRPEGLADEEAETRRAEHGPNVLAKDEGAGIVTLIGHALLSPLVVLLAALAGVSFATGGPCWRSRSCGTPR